MSLHLPADFQAFLSHPGNTAVINLFAQLVPEPTPPTPPGGAIPPVPGLPPLPPQSSAPLPPFTVNEINVGHAIDNLFNNGGALPPPFLSLFGLTGSNLTNALDQLSGEVATGAQKVAFQLTDQFLDPFVDGRGCIEYPVRAIVKGGPAESGQICSVGRRKIAKKIAKIAKNKRCYANTLRPRSRMLLKVMQGG